MQPLVSIITTNYNYGKYITDAVKSIAEQSYDPIELIVIDDASTDDSVERIQKLQELYKHRFSSFIVQILPENEGINGALNKAVKYIKGKIIIIFDADDLLTPHHVDTLVSALINANKVDNTITFAYCDCNLIDEKGDFIQRGLAKPFSSDLIEKESFLPRPSPIFAKKLLAHFPLPTHSKSDPKHSLWQSICRAGNIGVYIPEPLFDYRIHDRNYSCINKKIAAAKVSGVINNPVHLSNYWPAAN